MAQRRHPSPPLSELRVELLGSEAPVWRLVRLSSGVRLMRLHRVLLAALGWFTADDWWFEAAGVHYGGPNEADERQPAASVRLRHILPDTGHEATYVIRLDRALWTHRLSVDRLLTPNPDLRAAVCLSGAGTVPTANARASGFDVRVTNAELRAINGVRHH